ncbi:DUF1232 domain-containing protein [Candidatus Sumerlaeota bacterium]|nr:DUF1232 domain-containing protein [Candidatus Sumerlaeota bacterium]
MEESRSTPPQLPIPIPREYRDEARLREQFWPKFKRVASKIPGAADILALYFYMNSDIAPLQHKISVMATIAYFIIPLDLIPDYLGLIGYTDDLAVAMGLIKFIGADVMKPYRIYARKWLRGQVSGDDRATIGRKDLK